MTTVPGEEDKEVTSIVSGLVTGDNDAVTFSRLTSTNVDTKSRQPSDRTSGRPARP